MKFHVYESEQLFGGLNGTKAEPTVIEADGAFHHSNGGLEFQQGTGVQTKLIAVFPAGRWAKCVPVAEPA